jgi:hypothetical protein
MGHRDFAYGGLANEVQERTHTMSGTDDDVLARMDARRAAVMRDLLAVQDKHPITKGLGTRTLVLIIEEYEQHFRDLESEEA